MTLRHWAKSLDPKMLADTLSALTEGVKVDVERTLKDVPWLSVDLDGDDLDLERKAETLAEMAQFIEFYVLVRDARDEAKAHAEAEGRD